MVAVIQRAEPRHPDGCDADAAPALEAELRAHHARAWRWALACCEGRADEALEALQTTYLKVLDGRARFDGRSAFRTFLFGVIRITARELRRRALWVRLGVLRLEGQPPTLTGPDVERAMIESTESLAVRASLAALPARQRQLVELVFFHDLSVREAAAVLGVSAGTAARHYERAKHRLAAELAARGVVR